MNFPKSELSKQDALHLWITCRSEYAKEQMFLTNYGIVFFVMQRLGIPAFDEDMFQIGSIGLLKAKVEIVNADIWEYTPSCKFNTIYLDIWNYINTDVYRDSMKPLISRYRKFLVTKEVDNKRFIDCWCRLEAKNGVRI